MQNTIYSLENLFAIKAFRIPQYQRAYSWEQDPQLEAFLEDLRQQVRTPKKGPNKQYFLGTVLLHEEDAGNGNTIVNVVDGQQRMTTSVVFIATALALEEKRAITFTTEKAALLRRNFVRDDDSEQQKFRTIAEDEPFFQSAILRISSSVCEQDSPSSRRLKAAADFFAQQVAPAEWEPLLQALKTAKVMVYAVDSAEDATQIFELQNDRGKSLTSLEALKSFLMHCVYLHSSKNADDRLNALQTQFSKIFRSVEALAELVPGPDEDQLLAYHCAAFLGWSKDDYNNPKQLVKSVIKRLHGQDAIAWIETFVGNLVESFRAVEQLFARRDELREFSELLLLWRMASFWPLILKAWRLDVSPDKQQFRKTCRLLEVFAFRGYAVANLRTDTCQSTLYTTARDFSGDFAALLALLSEMSSWYRLDERFAAGLDNSHFYEAERSDALYLLWRYENYLREQIGQIQPQLSWRDVVEPGSYAAKLSVEHVAAKGNPIVETDVSWNAGIPEPFAAVALHRLGNLVIDSISSNSSKGKKDFSGKLSSLSESSIFLSQGELVRFLKNRAVLTWDVDAVRARHAHLIAFAQKTWHPSTWHSP